MAKADHADQARLQAAQAGLPPDVHDPATLAAYAALKLKAKAEDAPRRSHHKKKGAS